MEQNIVTNTYFGYQVSEYNNANVFVIEDLLSHSLCDKLKSFIDTIPLKHVEYFEGNNVLCNVTTFDTLLQKNTRQFYKFSLDTHEYNILLNNAQDVTKRISTNELNNVCLEEIKVLRNKINDKLSIIKKVLQSVNDGIKINTICDITLRKIYGATRLHCDGISDNSTKVSVLSISENKKVFNCKETNVRSATFLIQLNDDYEGGIFQFPKQNISIRLKRGSALIFPPYWTHKHHVTEMLNNTYRYTITTWGCENI